MLDCTPKVCGDPKIYRPTLTERLQRDRQELQARLDEINAALTALESNPQLQQVLDIVQKVMPHY